jgi:subtilisin family serine protease
MIESESSATELVQSLPRDWRIKDLKSSNATTSGKFNTLQAAVPPGNSSYKTTGVFNYGYASDQNLLLGIDHLHDQGFTGQNITIAFLDAGFAGFNASPALDSARDANRLIATKDFWTNSPNVFWGSTHGSGVLTEVAGNIPGVFVGMAPHVQILLALTDHVVTETHQDEFNYLLGLEWADSLGADLTSASLSYRLFDQGQGDYSTADMDGKTTIVAQGVKLAARKGMLIVNGAGNDLGFICTPCDADSILCVGGAQTSLAFDGISSGGPTADGRTKPDVAGITSPVATVDSTGMVNIMFYGGTSSATPLVAGLAACLKQKYPGVTNMQLIQSIKQSGHKAANPDNQLGWGVPNARIADSLLAIVTGVKEPGVKQTELSVFPNPVTELVTISAPTGIREAQVFSLAGQSVATGVSNGTTALADLRHAAPGVYYLKVTTVDGTVFVEKIVRK